MSEVPDQLEGLFGRAVGLSPVERMLVSLAAVVFAILLGTVVILAAGYVASGSPRLFILGVEFRYNPVEVYRVLFDGAFGSDFGRAATLKWTTLLLFTAVSFAIPYKAGLFNIGGQGQFVLGSLAAAVGILWMAKVAPDGLAGRLILVPTGILAGAAAGGVYGLLPGYLKVRFEMNEVITTLLLNFIATAVAFVLVDRYFDDSTISGTQTRAVPEQATFEPLQWSFPGIPLLPFPSTTNVSLVVFAFAVLTLVGMYWLLRRSAIGYDIRAMGAQPKAARFGGVSERFTTLFSMTTGGAVAGVGGAFFIMMVVGRWQTGAPGLGFDGIAVSILGGNNPIGLLPAGLLFGALQSGGSAIQFRLGIPSDLVGVLRGLIILLVATPELFRLIGKRLNKRGVIDVETGGEQ